MIGGVSAGLAFTGLCVAAAVLFIRNRQSRAANDRLNTQAVPYVTDDTRQNASPLYQSTGEDTRFLSPKTAFRTRYHSSAPPTSPVPDAAHAPEASAYGDTATSPAPLSRMDVLTPSSLRAAIHGGERPPPYDAHD